MQSQISDNMDIHMDEFHGGGWKLADTDDYEDSSFESFDSTDLESSEWGDNSESGEVEQEGEGTYIISDHTYLIKVQNMLLFAPVCLYSRSVNKHL